MNTAIRLLSFLGATIVLSACVTTTSYENGSNGYGYSDQKIEDNRYRVTFTGNSVTPKETVENYLLYRAAEITLDNGYDYFVMVDQGTEAQTEYRQEFVQPGGFGGAYYWYPRSYYPTTYGTTFVTNEYEAKAEIVLFKGAKPSENLRAYDAKSVKQNLAPTIKLRETPK